MDVSLQIYIKWMKLLSCLPSCLPFETLLFILIQSSQHRIGTGTDSVVFYMGRYNVFKLWLTIYKQYLFSRFQCRFQLSLIKEAWAMTTQISTKFATYFRVPLCPSLLKLWRKNVKPNIDFHLVLEIVFSYFKAALRGIKIKQQTHHLACFPSGQLRCYKKSVKCQYW